MFEQKRINGYLKSAPFLQLQTILLTSAQAREDFRNDPQSILEELGLDHDVSDFVNSPEPVKLSEFIISLPPIERMELVDKVSSHSIRAGDGGDGGDGDGDGTGDDGDDGDDDDDPDVAISTSFAVATNVAVVGEVAVAITAVSVVVRTSPVSTEIQKLQLSPLSDLSLGDSFRKTQLFSYLADKGLQDFRQRALLKCAMIRPEVKRFDANSGLYSFEYKFDGKTFSFDATKVENSYVVVSGALIN